MRRLLPAGVVVCVAAFLVGCGASASSSAGFEGFLHRSGRVRDAVGVQGEVTSEVWIGDNGGGLRRVGAVVEALPLHSVRFGAVPRGYREVVGLPRDPVALTVAVRGWAASPTDEENGAVPVGRRSISAPIGCWRR